MDPNVKLLLPNQGESLSNPKKYRRLVGKINYLIVTCSDISFVVNVVSQFLKFFLHVKIIGMQSFVY